MTQHWGDAYFHFLAECLPRITLMLDVLLEHPEIKVPHTFTGRVLGVLSAELWDYSTIRFLGYIVRARNVGNRLLCRCDGRRSASRRLKDDTHAIILRIGFVISQFCPGGELNVFASSFQCFPVPSRRLFFVWPTECYSYVQSNTPSSTVIKY